MAAIDRKNSRGPAESRLAELAREWFTEAREKTAQEDAELTAWNKNRKKWTAGSDGGLFDSSSGDGDCGGDGDGGSCD